MRVYILAFVGMAALFLAPIAAWPQQRDAIRCAAFGGIKEKVCATSFTALLAAPQKYASRVIAIQGQPKQLAGVHYLFLDDYSYKNNVISNAVVCGSGCSRLQKRSGIKTTLIGRFSTPVESGDLFKPVGKIDVVLIRELD